MKPVTGSGRTSRTAGFSFVESIAVPAIMVILIGVGLGTFQSMGKAASLKHRYSMVLNSMEEARALALSRYTRRPELR